LKPAVLSLAPRRRRATAGEKPVLGYSSTHRVLKKKLECTRVLNLVLNLVLLYHIQLYCKRTAVPRVTQYLGTRVCTHVVSTKFSIFYDCSVHLGTVGTAGVPAAVSNH
jgi:hypothetical protein